MSIGLATNLAGLAAGNYTINRGHLGQNFVIRYCLVSFIQTGIYQFINLTDPDTTNGLSITLPTSTGHVFGFEVNPKVFSNPTINITLTNAIPVNEFISIKLYGWYETQ